MAGSMGLQSQTRLSDQAHTHTHTHTHTHSLTHTHTLDADILYTFWYPSLTRILFKEGGLFFPFYR